MMIRPRAEEMKILETGDDDSAFIAKALVTIAKARSMYQLY